MKITKDNIGTLKHGDIVYMPFSFKVPEKYIYVCFNNNGYYYFIKGGGTEVIKIFKDNFEYSWEVSINGLSSTSNIDFLPDRVEKIKQDYISNLKLDI